MTRGVPGFPALAGRTEPFREGEWGWLRLVRKHLLPEGTSYRLSPGRPKG